MDLLPSFGSSVSKENAFGAENLTFKWVGGRIRESRDPPISCHCLLQHVGTGDPLYLLHTALLGTIFAFASWRACIVSPATPRCPDYAKDRFVFPKAWRWYALLAVQDAPPQTSWVRYPQGNLTQQWPTSAPATLGRSHIKLAGSTLYWGHSIPQAWICPSCWFLLLDHFLKFVLIW